MNRLELLVLSRFDNQVQRGANTNWFKRLKFEEFSTSHGPEQFGVQKFSMINSISKVKYWVDFSVLWKTSKWILRSSKSVLTTFKSCLKLQFSGDYAIQRLWIHTSIQSVGNSYQLLIIFSCACQRQSSHSV